MKKTIFLFCFIFLLPGLISCADSSTVKTTATDTTDCSDRVSATTNANPETLIEPETKENESVKKATISKIACIGDSLTYGDNGTVTAGAKNYPAYLSEMISEYGVTVRNYGLMGRVMSFGYTDTTMPDRSYNLSTAYTTSLEWEADCVILCLGTNDAWRCPVSTTIGQKAFRESAEAIISAYRTAGAKIIYLCLPPFNYDASHPNLELLLPILRQIATENDCRLIDFHTPTENKQELFQSDNLHLTPDGYKLMATTVYQRLLSDGVLIEEK